MTLLSYAQTVMSMNKFCGPIVWNWMKSKISSLFKTTGTSSTSFVANLFQRIFATQDLLDDVKLELTTTWKDYFTDNQVQGVLNNIRINIDFVAGLPYQIIKNHG